LEIRKHSNIEAEPLGNPSKMVSTRPSWHEQVDPQQSSQTLLPTMYDLPSEDPEEPGLPDEFHDLQPQLLSRTLRLADYDRSNYFTASDLNFYYDSRQTRWHKRPDWFLALDVPQLYDKWDLRRSYVTWQEGRSPSVIIEFLSPGTEAEDLGGFYDETSRIPGGDIEIEEKREKLKPPGKFEVYERYLQVPHYVVYSRYTQRLRYFKLENSVYQEQELNSDPPLIWLADLKIGLGIWNGEFEDIPSS
jgi:Uma2 family endonuclease